MDLVPLKGEETALPRLVMPKRKVVNSRLRQYSPKFEELRHWVALSASVMHFPNVSYFVRFYRRLAGVAPGASRGVQM